MLLIFLIFLWQLFQLLLNRRARGAAVLCCQPLHNPNMWIRHACAIRSLPMWDRWLPSLWDLNFRPTKMDDEPYGGGAPSQSLDAHTDIRERGFVCQWYTIERINGNNENKLWTLLRAVLPNTSSVPPFSSGPHLKRKFHKAAPIICERRCLQDHAINSVYVVLASDANCAHTCSCSTWTSS
jgi:hypothetical protein